MLTAETTKSAYPYPLEYLINLIVIAFAIKQHELGTRTEEICPKMGISDATFYKWRQKYAGLGPSELRQAQAVGGRKHQA